MTSTLIFYQVLLVLAGIPAGWVIGWFYRRDLRKVERGEARKTSLCVSLFPAFLSFLIYPVMTGNVSFALWGSFGTMILSMLFFIRQKKALSE
jgi:NhaP-type Na+/H+ or K+/H+ antiporter